MWRFPRYVLKKQLNLRDNSTVSLQEGAQSPSRLFSSMMCSITRSCFGLWTVCLKECCPVLVLHTPPVWNNPFSPLLGFWHLKYAWPPVLFSAFPGTVKDTKGVISMFPVVLRLIVQRLEVERTPMRSSLTSLGSNLGLFLCILLSGALSSSAVTWFKPQSSQSVPRAGKSQACVSYCQETFPDIQPKFSFP